ncbi:photosystem reaction center subunit H, partial [Streptomyces sp. URMC 126]
HETFVPIHDAAMVEDHLEVPYSKDQVKGAPHVDVDQGGHLSEQEERRLYDYYGVDWGGYGREETRRTGTGTAGTAG